MKTRKDTAFTVELLGLFILLTAAITIISSVFVMSRAHSLQAKQLTEAVILAESVAEVSSAAPDNEKLLDMLAEMDNCVGHRSAAKDSSESDGTTVIIAASISAYDPSANDETFYICVKRSYPTGTPDSRSDSGAYAEDIIEVYAPGTASADDIGTIDPSGLKDPVYTLTAGTYFGPESFTGKGGKS